MAPYACVVSGTLSIAALLAAHAALLVTGIRDLHPSQDLSCRRWLEGTCVCSAGFLAGWAWLTVRCLRCGSEFRDNHHFCQQLRLFLVVQGMSALAAGVVLQVCFENRCESSTWTLHCILQYGVAVLAGVLLLGLCLIRGPTSM